MIKRLFDIIFSGLALIALSFVILFLYLIIYKKLGSPVLFRQKRPGLHNNIFEMKLLAFHLGHCLLTEM